MDIYELSKELKISHKNIKRLQAFGMPFDTINHKDVYKLSKVLEWLEKG